MELNIASLLESTAARFPDKTAAIEGDRAITYAQMDDWASRVAAVLQDHGVRPGDVVALCCPNTLDFVACYYGALKCGATIMPINFLLKSADIAVQLRHTAAPVFLCHGGGARQPIAAEAWAAFNEVDTCRHFWRLDGAWPASGPTAEAPALADLVARVERPVPACAVPASQRAVITFTSGTTGVPKGVCTSHGAEYVTVLGTAAAYDYRREDIGLVVVPFFTGIAQALLLNPFVALGGTLVLQPSFDPEDALEAIQRHRVTLCAAVPTILHRLALVDPLPDAHDFSAHWRLAIYGGSAMDANSRDRFQTRFKVPVQQAYGLTETRVTAIGRAIGGNMAPHDGLTPAPGFVFSIVNPDMEPLPDGEKGELIVRGPGLMEGYFNLPEANAAAFHGPWFRTGDLVERREDGLYYVVGRIKDVIARGGFKVYPSEVEDLIRKHPAIRQVAVCGVPDPVYGEEIAAVLVSNTPDQPLDLADLEAWMRERLPRHMCPRLLAEAPAIPVNPTGKVRKDGLLAILSARASA